MKKYIMKELVNKLNEATTEYDKGTPIMSDKEWDKLWFELRKLEEETGIVLPGSPTNSIQFEEVSSLKKVEHNHPMLSLDKTKEIDVIKSFIGTKDFIAMAKMDGLTCSLYYKNGCLVSAETRGNGSVGEDILHNARVIMSIPKTIKYKEDLIVDGEIICTYKNFEKFKEEYKNPRNFAAGSVRLLDSKECYKRHLDFVAWDIVKGLDEYDYLSNKLAFLDTLGFLVVPFSIDNKISLEDTIYIIKEKVNVLSYPIDGIVFKYDNVEEYNSMGRTDHHFKGGLAYKFYDEVYETHLINIEWSMGRTGQISPIAIFENLNINGTNVSRASLSNLSIMKKTLGEKPFIGQTVYVSKRNEIIPKIEKAKDENDQWI